MTTDHLVAIDHPQSCRKSYSNQPNHVNYASNTPGLSDPCMISAHPTDRACIPLLNAYTDQNIATAAWACAHLAPLHAPRLPGPRLAPVLGHMPIGPRAHMHVALDHALLTSLGHELACKPRAKVPKKGFFLFFLPLGLGLHLFLGLDFITSFFKG